MSSALSLIKRHPVMVMVIISTIILFFCSSLRHLLYESSALDLGWFDQSVYLISVGLPPIQTFSDNHILGDHAAFIFYLIAVLYKVYPSVYWLFLIQATGLSIGALLAYQLSQQASLTLSQSRAIALMYLLYPLIFNVNLFDFHPEVIAVPTLFWAILAARKQKILQFILALLITLSCKEVLSLTVIFLGIWLIIDQKRKVYGMIALGIGTAWFLLTTQLIIPHFQQGQEAAAVGRYSFLGDSVLGIAQNLIFKPQILLSHLFTVDNLEYLALLLIPVFWCLNRNAFTCLIPTFPALFLNLLTDYLPQKNIIYQYSLSIVPFLCLAMITTLAQPACWQKSQLKWLVVWSCIGFLALAKYGYFTSLYLESLDTWQATNQAIALIKTQGGVLTNAQIAPHLTHRRLVKLAIDGAEKLDLDQFEYVLLNGRHPGWSSSPELIGKLLKNLQENNNFQPIFQQDDVLLLQQKSILNAATGEQKVFES